MKAHYCCSPGPSKDQGVFQEELSRPITATKYVAIFFICHALYLEALSLCHPNKMFQPHQRDDTSKVVVCCVARCAKLEDDCQADC